MSHDSHLQHAVLAALTWEPSVTAGHIGVTADHGVVTLTGHVETFAEKHAAEAAALGVKGVNGGSSRRSRSGFRSNSDDGRGSRRRWWSGWPGTCRSPRAPSWSKWRMDGSAARSIGTTRRKRPSWTSGRLSGVVGLSNHIAIKSQVDTSNICDDITHALHRSWFFDPEDHRRDR